ncbi:MAG: amino acid/amide ABC transporter substrate-binding protein, HAAT family [Rhodobacteraceae bacterium HLUCCA08]|nr:MAG: amino acid/amide ABC transporter substrate-binding protein, HAAT family [Rhodobacteraceae bacterium HLUCCA08]
MFARLPSLRLPGLPRVFARFAALAGLALMAACDVAAPGAGGDGGPRIDPAQPIRVALLVPGGSGQDDADFIAASLENAARMAIADLQGAQIDLRVYNTGRSANQAAAMTQTAIADGAAIILGPLDAQSAAAAGLAALPSQTNVLAFSNNTAIAGGNVFVLGRTFDNIADRLVDYTSAQGIDRYLILHQDDLAGQTGRDAVASAVRQNGGTLLGVEAYPFSQDGIFSRAPAIAQAVQSSGAEAVFVTDSVAGGLPILATALTDRGLDPAASPLAGLTRWDSAPQALSLPGLQNGYFALPDTDLNAAFERRYEATYGTRPHPLAGLAYDGIAAIGALVAAGDTDALTRARLTQGSGFQGTGGPFRLLSDGTNQRALAVARVQNNQVVIVDPAPRSFGGAGF